MSYHVTMKFGGTSVGSVEAIARLADIVRRSQDNTLHPTPGIECRQVTVVISAMSGVTNDLIRAAQQAVRGDAPAVNQIIQAMRQRHLDALIRLAPDAGARFGFENDIDNLLTHIHSLCRAITVLGELTPRGLDVISGTGERLAVRLVAAALQAQGIPAQAIEAGELIITDDHFGAANPLMEQTRDETRARLLPLLEQGITPVITGFIGATAEGVLTTLGRGGSDYSGTLIGACLDSDEIWIWSDVDGVMTADPRVVPEAQTIERLSFAEAAEFSYFGAKVIHPKTTLPAIERKIPIRIINSFNPEHPGTWIVAGGAGPTRANGHPVKGITAIKQVSQITVEGRGMMGIPGIAARVFSTVAEHGANVLMISQSSSEQSICFVVPGDSAARIEAALQKALEYDLLRKNIEQVWRQDDIAILAVVGEGMKGTVGVAGRLFTALADQQINILSIAQGSSEYNISLVVSAAQVDQAVRAVHTTFELGKQRSSGS